MMERTCYYKVGGHSLAITFVDEGNDERLIPSFAPFRLEEKPDEVVFSMMVDDHLDWEEDGEEVGVFDCGGCDHGVYRLSNGGYGYSVHDIRNVLCSRMRTNADFSVCQVSLQIILAAYENRLCLSAFSGWLICLQYFRAFL